MHIAICDDNIADRKQLERLLKKESDIRAMKSEGFYVDSFGNTDALLRAPMLYDAFFIDMCNGDITGLDVVQRLTEVGVNAPIILCSSKIHYQEHTFTSNVLFLDKPIKKDSLSDMIDHAIIIKSQAAPHIELREESGEYYYANEADIMYIVADGAYLKIHLTNGKVLSVLSTLANMYSQLTKYPMIMPVNKKTLINVRHLQALKGRKVQMCDGTAYRILREYTKYLKTVVAELK